MIELDETKAKDLNELLAFAENFRNRSSFEVYYYKNQCKKNVEIEYLFHLLELAKFYMTKYNRPWFNAYPRGLSANFNTKSFLKANGFINILNKELQEENIKNLTEKDLINMDINQRKKNRFLFLQKIFNKSNGSEKIPFNANEIGHELTLSEDETKNIIDYLIKEKLIIYHKYGDAKIELTHSGIKEVEQALEDPAKSTEHFLPINIINISNMTNSSLQQATNNSTINFSITKERLIELDNIIDQLKNIQETLGMSIELHKELVCEIQTLEIQKESPKPKNIIIAESLKTIRSLLENVVANAMTPTIIDSINKLLAHNSHK